MNSKFGSTEMTRVFTFILASWLIVLEVVAGVLTAYTYFFHRKVLRVK